jgi:predicted KAP-like P-loop ATPase
MSDNEGKPMSDSTGLLNFSADRPIVTIKDDLLGRGPFAISLANAICEWSGSESLVLALYGPWGTGKSSVKNMIVSLLKQREVAPTVVEFNPWEWSGENRLLEVFFDEIETAVRRGAKSSDAEELSKKWKRYSARLALGSTALEHLRTASEVAGMPWVPLIFGALSSALKQTAAVSQEASEAHAADAETESLEDLKKTLNEALAQLESPVLVIIDDVDRLHPQEIRTLFRLVKVNADFPNMIYMLLFDRHIVERALDEASGDTGRQYMEKIVQAGFDLPQVQQEALDHALGSALDGLLGSVAAKRTFDGQRWQSLFLSGLRPYCHSLRNIRRFVSSLSFQIGLYLRNGTLEVNVIDLIGVEALRVFEPELYHALSQTPQLVFGDRYSLYRDRESREDKIKRAEQFLLFAHEGSRTAAKGILRELFPQIDWMLKGHGHGMGFEDGWMRELRICHQDMFGRYFVMSVPPGDIPQSLLDAVIATSGDRESLREQFRALIENNIFVDFLKRLEAYKKALDLAHAESFATALFDVGDSLPVEFGGLFGLSPDMIACRILHFYLLQEKDRSRRSAILLTALEASEGHWLPIRMVGIEEPKPDERDLDNQVLDDDGLVKAKALCLDRIRRLAHEGALVGPRMSFYLWRWLQWGGEDEPRRWVESLTESLEGTLIFVEGLVQQVHVSSGRGSWVRYELKLSNVAAFANADKIKESLAPLFIESPAEELRSLADRFQVTIDAARAAYKRREEGRPDDDWGHDDE